MQDDPVLDVTMAFLRALQQKDYLTAISIAKDLEKLRPNDPNIAMFTELMAKAKQQFASRPPEKKQTAPKAPVPKKAPVKGEDVEESSEEEEWPDDGLDWDNIGDPEAIERLKKLGIMK